MGLTVLHPSHVPTYSSKPLPKGAKLWPKVTQLTSRRSGRTHTFHNGKTGLGHLEMSSEPQCVPARVRQCCQRRSKDRTSD